jgi:hypothetical protein
MISKPDFHTLIYEHHCLNIHIFEQQLSAFHVKVLTAVTERSYIFWDITICSTMKFERCFGEIYRLHLQGRTVNQYEVCVCFSRVWGRLRQTTWSYVPKP